ncbi:MAG: hypothetical protein CVU38_19840 [Chloroflexi bacterium HGW-Chloroflexi-1]|nr:MAG: hypothetical protein CVU38_19840 [Chloroflexi bacterium HGW-Chloroflexi-1]
MATKRIGSLSCKIITSLTLLVAILGASACASAPEPTPTRPPAPATEDVAPALTQAAALAAQAAAKVTEAAGRSTAEAATRAAQPTATLAPTATPPPTPIPSPTQPPTVSCRVTSDTLNVRGGPGTIYPKQAELRQGDRLTVLERDADGKWLRVRTPDGNEGWVAAELTDLGSAVAGVPLAMTIPPTPRIVARAGMIAFKSTRGGIWIMNADGGNQQPLANQSIYYNALRQGGPEYCARNGLYCVKADWGDGCNNMDIYVEDREYGTGWHKIVSNSKLDWDPRIHPDGWWVVFVTNRNGNDELFLINRQAGEPSWSPDGKRIAFFSNRVTGRRQIWVLDPNAPLKDNVNPRNISNNPYVDYEPVWLK